jgi:hypothetical protein
MNAIDLNELDHVEAWSKVDPEQAWAGRDSRIGAA